MNALKYMIFGGLVLVMCLGARSEKPEGEYQERAEAFLTDVMARKLDRAFDRLIGAEADKQKKEAMETLKIRTSTALMMLGKPVGMEFIRSQRYGESVVRLVYMVKYESGPLVWEFYFYNPGSEWKLVGIEFSDRLSLLGER